MDFDKEWNRAMIHADSDIVEEACQKNKCSINIGLIDSGISWLLYVGFGEGFKSK